jgi:hypothetical protein
MYIDPGSSGFIVQILIGAAAGMGLAIATFWRRIVSFFSRKPKDQPVTTPEADADEPAPERSVSEASPAETPPPAPAVEPPPPAAESTPDVPPAAPADPPRE